MPGWLEDNAALGWWLVALSGLVFLASLILLPLWLVRMPPDYFTQRERPVRAFEGWHPAVRFVLLVLKNMLGLLFLAAGLIMLFTPGQGILAVLIGVSLLNIPGKRALERRIVGNRKVLRAINRLRARARRPPLEMPERPHRRDKAHQKPGF